jgi:hypothetical protein
MRLADRPDVDAYMQFMALWIAFNACCYACYAHQAQRERADIRKFRGIDGLTSDQQPVAGTIHCSNNRINIDLESPAILKIVITEKVHGGPHQKHAGECYVINMAIVRLHDAVTDLSYMEARNIIVRLTNTRSLRRLKEVLYKIRCNMSTAKSHRGTQR